MKHCIPAVARFHLRVSLACLIPVLSSIVFGGGAFAQSIRPYVRWTLQEDFRSGIPGWMSFPLPQDVGYDPTIYTAQIGGAWVLERDVLSHGERVLHVGVLRALRFHATPASSFQWSYQLEPGGPVERLQFVLAAANGRRYTTPLTAGRGTHQVRIAGSRLGLPAGGDDIVALVLQADIQRSIVGSRNRLIISSFEIKAERQPELSIETPTLVRSHGSGIAVADRAMFTELRLALSNNASSPVRVTLYDGSGALVRAQTIPLLEQNAAHAVRVSLGDHPAPGLWKAEVRAGRARTKFRFLVLGRVPPHPRVLLTVERLAQLRSLQDSDDLLRAMQTKAAELRAAIAYNPQAGENISLLPGVSVFPGLPEYFSLMENYSNAIAFNAVEFRLSGDREALEAARRALLAISQWPTWTPGWFRAHGLYTYYEVGVFTQRVACGYDLIADELTAQEKSPIADAMWRNAIEPAVEEYFLSDRMPIAASNHMAHAVGGALAAAVALYGDVPGQDERLGLALAELEVAYEQLLRGLFPGDGSEAEPAGYEDFAMEGMSFGLAALHALGIRPHGVDKMLQAFWWPRYAEVTPSLVLDTGDFSGTLGALSGYAWGAEHANDPQLQAFYESAPHGTLLGISGVAHTGRKLEEAPGLLDLVCCTRKLEAGPLPRLSRIFPLRGSAVLRSGWKPTDTVISIRVGPWFNHEHHDQGTFQVAAFGEPLVSEAGYADYYKDPRYADYFMQAAGHNTLLVDRDPFSQPGENGRYWRAFDDVPRIERHVFSPAVDFVDAQLAPAYDGELTSFHRDYLFLKPDLLLVHDAVTAPSPHLYQWLLHVPIDARSEVAGSRASIVGTRSSATLLAIGANTTWKLRAVPLAADRFGDLDRIKLRQPQELRLESQAAASAYFLVGMRFQSIESNLAALRSIASHAGQELSAGTSGGAWNALFRTGPGVLASEGLTSDGDVLATRRAGESVDIFAANFRTLEQDGEALLSSRLPVDAVYLQSETGLEAYLAVRRDTSLKLRVNRPKIEATLDGVKVSPSLAHHDWTVDLAPGEHHVQIRY